MALSNRLDAACTALDATGGVLKSGTGAGLNKAQLEALCVSFGLDDGQQDLLGMAIQGVADARQMAKDMDQLKDYNLLGLEVTFDAGSFYSVPVMRNRER